MQRAGPCFAPVLLVEGKGAAGGHSNWMLHHQISKYNHMQQYLFSSPDLIQFTRGGATHRAAFSS